MEECRKKRQREQLKREWDHLLPLMVTKTIKYISFKEYFDRVTGANIDTRPAEEILAEADAIRQQLKGE